MYRRRDYALLSPHVAGSLAACHVDYDDSCPVHAPTHLAMRMGSHRTIRTLQKCGPLAHHAPQAENGKRDRAMINAAMEARLAEKEQE